MEAQVSQASAQVNVEVDAPPQQDLFSIMEDIRKHYERDAEKNRKELEKWQENKVSGQPRPVWLFVCLFGVGVSFCPVWIIRNQTRPEFRLVSSQVDELNKLGFWDMDHMEKSRSEISYLKQTLQTLEMDLHSQHSMVCSAAPRPAFSRPPLLTL